MVFNLTNKQNFRIVSCPEIMFLLLQFNTEQELEFQRILEILNIPSKRLKSILSKLTKPNKKSDAILVKKETSDAYYVNPNFQSKTRVLNIIINF